MTLGAETFDRNTEREGRLSKQNEAEKNKDRLPLMALKLTYMWNIVAKLAKLRKSIFSRVNPNIYMCVCVCDVVVVVIAVE